MRKPCDVFPNETGNSMNVGRDFILSIFDWIGSSEMVVIQIRMKPGGWRGGVEK